MAAILSKTIGNQNKMVAILSKTIGNRNKTAAILLGLSMVLNGSVLEWSGPKL